jgi:hypothetical protein
VTALVFYILRYGKIVKKKKKKCNLSGGVKLMISVMQRQHLIFKQLLLILAFVKLIIVLFKKYSKFIFEKSIDITDDRLNI